MIRRVLRLVGKDFRIFLADKPAIALSFIVPMVMILVFGLVFGGSDGGIEALEVLAVNQDTGPAGARLFRALDLTAELQLIEQTRDSVRYDSLTARARVERGKSSAAIVLPADFSERLKGCTVALTILEDPRDPLTAGIVTGLLQQQIFRTFPGLMPVNLAKQSLGDSLAGRGFSNDLRRAIERNFQIALPESTDQASWFPEDFVLGADAGAEPAAAGFGVDSLLSKMMQIKREVVVGQQITNPGIAQSVAGPAVMFMLFAVGAIAASLLREMRGGTASRLLSGPVSSGELLLSKYVNAVALGALQLLAMMIYGWLIFGLEFFEHLPAALFVIVCTAAAMSSIGLITAAVSRTEEQATGLQVVVILGMSAIGGAMFPSFMIPKFVRAVAQLTPVHWSMQGFTDVFWRDQGVSGVVLEGGILLGFALVLVAVAIVMFRRRLAAELS
ncbi:ABC-2 transporter permease [candidate division KSB1 bacterium]|nr:ABC-2 transporter permease [candidate division KSB1 bacterium]